MCRQVVRVLSCVLAISIISTSCKETIQIVWLVPFSSHPGSIFPHNASQSVGALALGIKRIKDEGVLREYELK